MGVLLLLVAVAAGGLGVWRALCALESKAGRLSAEAGVCEDACGVASCGLALWIALDWLLAFAHVFTAVGVVGAAVVSTGGGVALVVWARRRVGGPGASAPRRELGRADAMLLLALAPVALWLVYASARGAVLPVVTPDANSYHFPKALLLLRAHGFARFVYPDFRVAGYPFDYELLLADVLAVDGSDRATAAITVLFFVLFLLVAAAQAERAWGSRGGAVAAALLTAATPIGLLQSGEHKNDLFAATCSALAFFWVGRWIARGERLVGALVVVTTAIALGTKASAAFVAVIVAPLFLVGLVRVLRTERAPGRAVAVQLAVVAGAILLLGVLPTVLNVVATGRPYGEAPAFAGETGYGAWKNLYAFPYLLLTAPYSPSAAQVWVPWAHQWWWWMRYEMHTSHFGILFTPIALGSIAVLVLDLRRPSSPQRTARLVTLGASLVAAAAMVPMRLAPWQEGSFNCFARYMLWVLPAVTAYAIPPIFAALARRGAAGRRLQGVLVGACSLFFASTALEVGWYDIYEPAQWAWAVFVGAGDELPPPVQSSDRVEFALDHLAGPRDKVLFDAGFDAWTYRAFGADGQRPVVFAPGGLEPVVIPDDVQWVAVDSSYHVIWGDPAFRTMGDALAHFFRGKPAPEDLRTMRQLARDPRFRLVYRSLRSNQALYQRRPPGERPEDDPAPIIVPGLS